MRLPLSYDLESRDGSLDKDAKLINAYGKEKVNKRPGVDDLGLVTSGTSQLLACWNGLLSIIGDGLQTLTIAPTTSNSVIYVGDPYATLLAAPVWVDDYLYGVGYPPPLPDDVDGRVAILSDWGNTVIGRYAPPDYGGTQVPVTLGEINGQLWCMDAGFNTFKLVSDAWQYVATSETTVFDTLVSETGALSIYPYEQITFNEFDEEVITPTFRVRRFSLLNGVTSFTETITVGVADDPLLHAVGTVYDGDVYGGYIDATGLFTAFTMSFVDGSGYSEPFTYQLPTTSSLIWNGHRYLSKMLRQPDGTFCFLTSPDSGVNVYLWALDWQNQTCTLIGEVGTSSDGTDIDIAISPDGVSVLRTTDSTVSTLFNVTITSRDEVSVETDTAFTPTTADLSMVAQSTGSAQSQQQLFLKSTEQAWIYTR